MSNRQVFANESAVFAAWSLLKCNVDMAKIRKMQMPTATVTKLKKSCKERERSLWHNYGELISSGCKGKLNQRPVSTDVKVLDTSPCC